MDCKETKLLNTKVEGKERDTGTVDILQRFGKWSAKGGKAKETAYTGYILVPESEEMLFMKQILNIYIYILKFKAMNSNLSSPNIMGEEITRQHSLFYTLSYPLLLFPVT